jgi:hypothetical protein
VAQIVEANWAKSSSPGGVLEASSKLCWVEHDPAFGMGEDEIGWSLEA